eukprot:356737-Chlamydomonas_euryale.AAC.4
MLAAQLRLFWDHRSAAQTHFMWGVLACRRPMAHVRWIATPAQPAQCHNFIHKQKEWPLHTPKSDPDTFCDGQGGLTSLGYTCGDRASLNPDVAATALGCIRHVSLRPDAALVTAIGAAIVPSMRRRQDKKEDARPQGSIKQSNVMAACTMQDAVVL